MPTFVFTSPEGVKYQIEGPEGATEAEAFKILQQKLVADNKVSEKKTLGEKFGQFLKDTSVKGLAELGATAVTSTASTVAGNSLGVSLAAANRIRRAMGLEPTKVRNLATGEMTTSGFEAARGVKEAGTYQPRTTSGQNVAKIAQFVTAPITKTAEFAGDVVKEVTGSPLAGDLTSDAATAFLGYGVGKIAPKVGTSAVNTYKVAKHNAPVIALKAAEAATSRTGAATGAATAAMTGNVPLAAALAATHLGNKVIKRRLEIAEKARADRQMTYERPDLFGEPGKSVSKKEEFPAIEQQKQRIQEEARIKAEAEQAKIREQETIKSEIETGKRDRWGNIVDTKPTVKESPVSQQRVDEFLASAAAGKKRTPAEIMAELRSRTPNTKPAETKSVAELVKERNVDDIKVPNTGMSPEQAIKSGYKGDPGARGAYKDLSDSQLNMMLGRNDLSKRVKDELRREWNERNSRNK